MLTVFNASVIDLLDRPRLLCRTSWHDLGKRQLYNGLHLRGWIPYLPDFMVCLGHNEAVLLYVIIRKNNMTSHLNVICYSCLRQVKFISIAGEFEYKGYIFKGGVTQWVARLTRWLPVSREFDPNQRHPLFP